MGESASLVCTAGGNPDPQIVWTKNNEYLPIELHTGLVEMRETVSDFPGDLDATRSTLVFSELVEGDAGVYMCRASNGIDFPVFLPGSYTVEVIPGIVGQAVCFLDIMADGQKLFRNQSFCQLLSIAPYLRR